MFCISAATRLAMKWIGARYGCPRIKRMLTRTIRTRYAGFILSITVAWFGHGTSHAQSAHQREASRSDIRFAGLLMSDEAGQQQLAVKTLTNRADVEHHHEDEMDPIHEGLHFSHPLISESPSPDTKVRLDYLFSHDKDEDQHTAQLELEYAFARWVSVEANIPYTFLEHPRESDESHLDNIEIGVKFACFCFEQYGLLFGGGIEFGLPTGDDSIGIGSNNELEIEPFIDMGWKVDRFELVAFLAFGIPTNESDDEKDEVDLEIGYSVSMLYHVTDQVMVLLEFDGEAVASGHENESVLNITPGMKIRPWLEHSFEIGVGVSLPVTRDKEFDVRTVLSFFYHF